MVLTVGSRAQVMHGTRDRTLGGLRKKDLKRTRHGRIVSKKASKAAKKGRGFKALKAGGYVVSRGTSPRFGVPKPVHRRRRRS